MSKIKMFALGGLNESGKNTYVIEIDNKIFIFDCGLKYATDSMYGIDYIIPNYQYLIDTLYEYINLDVKIKVYDNRIREVLNYTEKCTCTVHTISFLADMVSLSRSRLSHLFREQVGIPLKSYIQFHQMQKAFFALLSGKTITEAAMLANFDSPSHFAAVTKRMMGMPASLSSKNSVFLKVYDV